MKIINEKFNVYENKIYNKIYAAILNNENFVSLLGVFNTEKIQRIVIKIKYEHAELFYVDFQKFSCTKTSTGIIYYIHYTVQLSLRKTMIENMEKLISLSLNRIDIKEDDTVACIYRKIHNYLLRTVRYADKALQCPTIYPEAFTIKGVFEQGEAVCEGITKAFILLCRRVGVKNVSAIEGKAFSEKIGGYLPHAWNVAGIDNSFFHIDITWDMNVSCASKYNRYDYFMISDDWMKIDHVYTSDICCQSIEQSYFAKKDV